jgi:hypothetical protein
MLAHAIVACVASGLAVRSWLLIVARKLVLSAMSLLADMLHLTGLSEAFVNNAAVRCFID